MWRQILDSIKNNTTKSGQNSAKQPGGDDGSGKRANKSFSYFFDHMESVIPSSHEDSGGCRQYVRFYCNNVIVRKCIDLLAKSASHVPWRLHVNKGGVYHKLSEHPMLDLLSRPNPFTAGAEFFERLIANKLIYGNAYIMHAQARGKKAGELYLLGPENIEIEYDSENYPLYYRYQTGKGVRKFHINKINGASQLLHIKNYNPEHEFDGLSAIAPAKKSIEQHNLALQWNNSLLQNGARPSGALILNSASGGMNYLDEEQFDRLKTELEDKYSHAAKAGKPMLLEGGLDWKEMSISPKDMDFIEAKNSAAREIALSLGVPPQLLGITGDNTYNNMQEARLALWEETLLPLLDNLCDSLNNWLNPVFGEDLVLDINKDEISALSERRESNWEKIQAAEFMTINEKRARIGLPPIEGGDKLA
jgi:HK97 family phage portal protein